MSGSDISDVIARYENDEWSLYGNLQKRRYKHGSIVYGTEMLVIGGSLLTVDA